jgi:hypothetical protein
MTGFEDFNYLQSIILSIILFGVYMTGVKHGVSTILQDIIIFFDEEEKNVNAHDVLKFIQERDVE